MIVGRCRSDRVVRSVGSLSTVGLGGRFGRLLMFAAALYVACHQAGCSVNRSIENPDFPVTMAEAKQDLSRMRDSQRALERPVVVLAGYRSWPQLALGVRWRLIPVTSGDGDQFMAISYMFKSDIEQIAGYVVDQIEERWPSGIPSETVEVDVVAISMGGLVARTASLELGDLPGGTETRSKRLNIGTLYTLGSPHLGAKLAERIAPDKAANSMKPGSPFLQHLNSRASQHDYEIVPYAHLNDTWVGATNTAPPGQDPIWTGGTHLMSHFSITTDDRIMADLSRRLRGEEPIAAPSPAPED
ncbi:MAG: hypothetical protein AAFR96_02320 [Planctomycetota bacterium]